MAASFPDVTEKTTHAEAILALVDAGIIKGNTDGTFKPDAQIKRGDAAVMIARALNLLDGKDSSYNGNRFRKFKCCNTRSRCKISE